MQFAVGQDVSVNGERGTVEIDLDRFNEVKRVDTHFNTPSSLDSEIENSLNDLLQVSSEIEDLKAMLYDQTTDRYVLRNATWSKLDRINNILDPIYEILSAIQKERTVTSS